MGHAHRRCAVNVYLFDASDEFNLCPGSFPFLTRYPELTLDYWTKKFGDMYSIWLGNQLFVVVSDPKIIKDLMVTNGAVFSSRKEMFIKSQTIFKGRGITATPYNERWSAYVLRTKSQGLVTFMVFCLVC